MINQFDPLYTQAQLIVKRLQNDLSEQDTIALLEWIDADEANRTLFNELTNEQLLLSELAILDKFNTQNDWQKIADKTVGVKKKQPFISINRRIWLAAASVLLIALVGYFQLWVKPSNSNGLVKKAFNKSNDILPGGNRATLKLADGTIITLNDSVNGFQAKQQHVNLSIQNGEITYQSIGLADEIIFNTVVTPIGGQYKLLLDDGTKVWLNAASSLKYPTAFSGNDRTVELTGEGYFEVAHNPSKPFKVILPGIGRVEAIGTEFNINAYADERAVNTTLLQGKVLVFQGNNSMVLQPLQQSQFLKSGKIVLSDQFNMDEVVAWKNGQFIFNRMNVENIMRQIGRWYDIEVVYSNKNNTETFSGIVSKRSNLSEVLKIMEEGGVKFKIEGKKITVY